MREIKIASGADDCACEVVIMTLIGWFNKDFDIGLFFWRAYDDAWWFLIKAVGFAIGVKGTFEGLAIGADSVKTNTCFKGDVIARTQRLKDNGCFTFCESFFKDVFNLCWWGDFDEFHEFISF